MLFPLLLCFNHLNLFALHLGRQFVLHKIRLQCIVDSLSDRRMIPHYRPDESMIEVLLARSDIEVKSWLYKAICEEKESRDFCNSQQQLNVGFDIEWGIDKVSLTQISTSSSALLIQMNYFTDKDSQASLIEILNSERVLNVGVGILQDLQRLKSDFGMFFLIERVCTSVSTCDHLYVSIYVFICDNFVEYICIYIHMQSSVHEH
jgi:hypothetical protein